MSLPTPNAVVADLISTFFHLFLANVLSLGLLSDMIQWFNHEILVVLPLARWFYDLVKNTF